IVVPSVAIREGVLKSFEVTAEHFQTEYGKQARFFVYQSSRLGDLDTFANSTDIQVMIINSQAFNAKGKDARRIHMEQESFRWRKPIDVIAATRPILIIDEPQSVEGKKTKESLQDFKPLFTLRYSATHKEKYDMVYRLDAMDAYNKKLVKKIAVKAIDQSGTRGTDGYLYLQELIPQKSGGPKARIEFEVLGKSGIRRQTKIVSEGFNLYAESGELEAYRDGWTLSDFDARDNSIRVGANRKLYVGEIIGDVNELDMRRIQIRETIKSHFEKEERLYDKDIKVLSLFFIDEVAKYKVYDEQNNALNGEYAQIFEEEYHKIYRDYLEQSKGKRYHAYLEKVAQANQVHAGYFSVDKNKKTGTTKFIDSKVKGKENGSDDQDAYDLIMKDKERLLSFEEPIRFLFSHSALKEGWDNPNVFQICTLKYSGAEIRKRQEIGRGMRLAVDQNGIRQDEELLGTQVHDINKLTVIANESYEQFATSLQSELKEVLSDRPVKIDTNFFIGKKLYNENGNELTISEEI
ncbi:DEAD/DEAH box helicase, partial [Streptococcus uberis]|nr:DEAD/DEAH box helicase [Streptococcus uberis]